jgi:hypothetical protein
MSKILSRKLSWLVTTYAIFAMGHANFVKLKGKTLATRSYADAWAGTMTGEPSNVVKIESLHKIGKGVERL